MSNKTMGVADLGDGWKQKPEPGGEDASSLAKQLAAMIAENSRLAQQVDAQKRILAELNPVDSKLGLANRHAYQQRVLLEIAMAARGRCFGLVVLNVEHFPQLTVLRGIRHGWRILEVLVDKVQSCISSVDLFAHLGGGEFVVLLPDRKVSEIETITDAIHHKLQELQVSDVGNDAGERVTSKLGYSWLRGPFVGSFDSSDLATRLYRLADRNRHRRNGPLGVHTKERKLAELQWQEPSPVAILERSIGHQEESLHPDSELVKVA